MLGLKCSGFGCQETFLAALLFCRRGDPSPARTGWAGGSSSLGGQCQVRQPGLWDLAITFLWVSSDPDPGPASLSRICLSSYRRKRKQKPAKDGRAPASDPDPLLYRVYGLWARPSPVSGSASSEFRAWFQVA